MIRAKALSVVLAVSLAVVPTFSTRAFAGDATAADESALVVQPGDLGGNLVELDGKTPIKGSTVQLLDKDGKIVAEGTTDEKGAFTLGKRDAGSYTLNVGRAQGKLVVKEGAKASSLKFVLDKTVAQASAGDSKAAGVKLAAISTTGAVLIGIGALALGLGAGIGIGYGVWGTQSTKNVFVPVPTSP